VKSAIVGELAPERLSDSAGQPKRRTDQFVVPCPRIHRDAIEIFKLAQLPNFRLLRHHKMFNHGIWCKIHRFVPGLKA
jgi:hypothetical protein